MIENDQQYEVTKQQLAKFERALVDLEQQPLDSDPDIHPILAKAQQDAIKSTIEDLNAQIQAYESIRQVQVVVNQDDKKRAYAEIVLAGLDALVAIQKDPGARFKFLIEYSKQYDQWVVRIMGKKFMNPAGIKETIAEAIFYVHKAEYENRK